MEELSKKEQKQIQKYENALKKRIGARIALYRKAKNLSQEKLAELSKISVSSLSYIETGSTHPKPDTLIKIAAVLDTDVYSLLNFKQADNISDMMKSIQEALEFIKTDEDKVIAAYYFFQKLL